MTCTCWGCKAAEPTVLDGCAFCDNRWVWRCDECERMVCNRCSQVTARDADGVPDEVLCNPDSFTWPGEGCYRPPVAEVAP